MLTSKDIEDLQQFAAKHQLDYVAASFVQSKADVQFIRRVLDEANGQHVSESAGRDVPSITWREEEPLCSG